MQLDESPHHCESDAQAYFGTRIGLVRLFEKIEYMRQCVRRDANPGIPDTNHGLPVSLMHTDCECATGVRVSRGICEQVYEHLLQAALIALQPHWRVGKFDSELLVTLVKIRLKRFDCVNHNHAKVYSFAL